jgi:hypothetical protein
LAAVRFFRCGYFEADLFVDDACAKCGDHVLAMKTRREHATESELTYTCLRCGTCCKL